MNFLHSISSLCQKVCQLDSQINQKKTRNNWCFNQQPVNQWVFLSLISFPNLPEGSIVLAKIKSKEKEKTFIVTTELGVREQKAVANTLLTPSRGNLKSFLWIGETLTQVRKAAG
jgi:hypothetical protein